MSFKTDVQAQTKEPLGLNHIKGLITKSAERGRLLSLPRFYHTSGRTDFPPIDEAGVIAWLKHEGFAVEETHCVSNGKHNGFNITW